MNTNDKTDLLFEESDGINCDPHADELNTANAVLRSNFSRYKIIIPENSSGNLKETAKSLKSQLDLRWGTDMEIALDSQTPSACEILIGDTNRPQSKDFAGTLRKDNSYGFTVYESKLIFGGKTENGIEKAVLDFKKAFLSKPVGEDEPFVTDRDSVSSEYAELRAATFNLYCLNVEARVNGVVNFIKEYSPDTIGVQEATYQWITGLAGSELKENYDYIGEGRDGGTNGEYNAIFYRKDKLRVIEEGTCWLSPTPDVVSTIGGLCRIMTYGVFEELSTGKTFVHINTHLDHTSDKIRVDQIMYLKEIMEEHKLLDHHMILTGDFNSLYKEEPYEAMVKLAVGFENTAEIAAEGDSPEKFTWDDQMVIDYIFISKTTPIAVKNYRVYDEKVLSDHCPVYIDYVY